MLVILFTSSDDRALASSRNLRDRLIYLLKHWDKVRAMNCLHSEKEMYNYITNVMLKDLKS